MGIRRQLGTIDTRIELDRAYRLAGRVLSEALGDDIACHIPSDLQPPDLVGLVTSRIGAMKIARRAVGLHWTHRATFHVLCEELEALLDEHRAQTVNGAENRAATP